MQLPNLFGSNKRLTNGQTVLSNHNISKERQLLPKPCSCKKGGRRRKRSRKRSRKRKRSRRKKRRKKRSKRKTRSRKYRGGGYTFNQSNFPTRGLNWKSNNTCKQKGGGPDSRYLGGKSPGSIYYGYHSPNQIKGFRGSYAPTTRKVYKQCGGKKY